MNNTKAFMKAKNDVKK